MKIRLLFFSLIMFVLFWNQFTFAQFGQTSISGYVKDADTGERLAGVNVYLSGTYWGASTSTNGFYEIKSIVPGGYEIVASMVGYKPVVRTIFLSENKESKFDFHLLPKIYEMGDVNVNAEMREEWYDQLDLFKKYFLGRRDFASDCVIENEAEINFFENDSMYYAQCENPLKIYNYGLGYIMDCMLCKFEYNKQTGGCNYIIKPRFTEMVSNDEDELEDWEDNREECYWGSQRQFFVNLANDNLIDSDFLIIYAIKRNMKRRKMFNPKSSIYYYSDASLQKLLDSTIERDSESGEVTITSSKQWIVDYCGWISTFNLPYGTVTLDKYGYPKQLLAINVIGDWSTYGVADMLPRFYELRFIEK